MIPSISTDVSVQSAASITEIDASEWDRLADHDVLASHAWLRTLEDSAVSPQPCRYVLLRGSEGILGAVAGHVDKGPSQMIDLDQMIFGRFATLARRLGFGTLPSLVCGTRMGVTGPILLRRDLPATERGRLMNDVAQAVEELACENRWTVCFRNVPQASSQIIEVLRSRGYLHMREMPTAYLDIGWNSFEEFRRCLKANHPATARNLAKEINRGRRSHVVIEQVEDPTRYGDRLHGLLDSHYHRLNRKPFPFGPRFLERLKSRLGERALIYVAHIDDEPVGVMVGLRNEQAVYLSMVGIDPARARPGSVYFNLGYNRPIRDSIAAGDRRVYFGKLLYALKASRGCKALDGGLYYLPRVRSRLGPLRLLFAYRSRRVRAASAVIPREE